MDKIENFEPVTLASLKCVDGVWIYATPELCGWLAMPADTHDNGKVRMGAGMRMPIDQSDR